jgi:DNA repair exonuclease SbcCD nuclease subunit
MIKGKFIVTADWHLWPTIWKRFPSITGDAEAAVAEVLRVASEKGADVICAGDIIDSGEQGAVSREINFLADTLKEHPSTLYYVVGNHDVSGFTAGQQNPRWLSILEKAEGVSAKHVGGIAWGTYNGFVIGGLDYVRGASFSEAIKAYRSELDELGVKLDVLVLHQALKETLGFEGAYQTCCEELEGIAPLVIVGDIHIPQKWEHGQTTFISPGSTVRNSWSEISFKDGVSNKHDVGYWEVDLERREDGSLDIKAERHFIENQRTFYDLNADTPEKEVNILKLVEDASKSRCALSPALGRVRYPAEHLSFVTGLKAAAIASNILLDLRPQHVMQESADKELLDLQEDGEGYNIEAIVSRHVDVEKDALLKQVVQEILEDDNRPDLILDRYVSAIKAGEM